MKNEAKYKEYHILIEDNNSVKILSCREGKECLIG